MLTNQYMDYIEAGLGIPPDGKEFRKFALGPCLMVLLVGLIPCVVLGGNWLILLYVMLVTSFSSAIAVFVISFKPLSIVSRLVMQALIYSNCLMQFFLVELLFYLIAWGVDWGLVPIFLVPLLVPFVLGLQNAKILRENQVKSPKKPLKYWLPLGWTGILGVFLAKTFLNEMSNKAAILFVIIMFSIATCFISIGLLSYQRLYFYKKYVK